eukprot:CAMPEP_0197050434 /NCGR_PEP_ID=MMETSP1384-20130603/25313_1 /TAXON_ID=29189 /ORGANISM="Ammonia sp." /LENGTH=415 /DNA_ID=CAMNT_0042482829 /DNA_START=26 /DNA_END=1273 /DNA_ORIENTATION=-
MGSCASASGGSSNEKQLTSLINKELDSDKVTITKHKKILFLGSGGTGKSTVFKQLRNIHGEGFGEKDREDFLVHIHSQIVNEMKTAIEVFIAYHQRRQQREKQERKEAEEEKQAGDAAAAPLDMQEEDELLLYDRIELEAADISNVQQAELLRKYTYSTAKRNIDDEVFDAIATLWSEPAIKEIYDKRNITRLETSSAHFWNRLDEIRDAKYLPSDEDILLCRLITTGLHEMTFSIKNDTFNIIDVGGQRSQRRKWIHCFEHVVAVIYITDLSCYDQVLFEDTDVNSMVDQIELFDDVCNTASLLNTSMILFLNKTDLFRQKYVEQKIALQSCPAFASFEGSHGGVDPFDFEKATKYIQDLFVKLNKSEKREIFTHLTCATDKNNIERVFADVQLIVISAALNDGGYMDLGGDDY